MKNSRWRLFKKIRDWQALQRKVEKEEQAVADEKAKKAAAKPKANLELAGTPFTQDSAAGRRAEILRWALSALATWNCRGKITLLAEKAVAKALRSPPSDPLAARQRA